MTRRIDASQSRGTCCHEALQRQHPAMRLSATDEHAHATLEVEVLG